jgi:hypothetical protein
MTSTRQMFLTSGLNFDTLYVPLYLNGVSSKVSLYLFMIYLLLTMDCRSGKKKWS